MLTVVIDGKKYVLNEKQVTVMKYFEEAQALEKGQQIIITKIQQKTFELIIKILEEVDYNIEEPPKMTANVLEDLIGTKMAALLKDLDFKEINQLYRAVHYLKMPSFRKVLAAVIACRIYMEPTLENFNKKKAELGITTELTTEKSKQYR